MNKKRGVSPLIASVLLISFVILLFVLVSSWVRKSAIEPGMEASEEKLGTALDCINTEIEIVDVCRVDVGDAIIQIEVDNMGDTYITGLGIRVIGDEASELIDISSTDFDAAPFERINGDTGTVVFTKADYGEVLADWKVEVYPEIGKGICRDSMQTKNGVTDGC